MLMICWFGCGPSVKRENGTVTAMPGCRTKVRAQEEEKDEQKNNVEQRKDVEPAEADGAGSRELHFSLGARTKNRPAQRSKRRSALFSCAC